MLRSGLHAPLCACTTHVCFSVRTLRQVAPTGRAPAGVHTAYACRESCLLCMDACRNKACGVDCVRHEHKHVPTAVHQWLPHGTTLCLSHKHDCRACCMTRSSACHTNNCSACRMTRPLCSLHDRSAYRMK